MAELNLFFPQWQGAGQEKTLYSGAQALKEEYGLEDFVEVSVSTEQGLRVQNEVLGFEPLMEQLASCMEIVQEKNPQTIFTVGGGCDVELAPVSYLNERYQGELSVLWFDAHGDLNTPQSSFSKLFHGMPLRALLCGCAGTGGKTLFSSLKAEQVTLIGTRDLDEPEAAYIAENGLKVLPVEHVALRDASRWIKTLSNNVYIHIDLDVLEPKRFGNVMCPVAGGLLPRKLAHIVAEICRSRRVVGMSLLEYTEREPDGSAISEEGAFDVIRAFLEMGINLISEPMRHEK